MKKIMFGVATVICIMLGSVISVNAVDAESVAPVATAAGESVVPAYEATVIKDALGRAGVATEDGAKGIVFEVLYRDKKNLQDFFNQGIKTQLAKSSTDPVADLVVTDADGSVIELIQCKDGISKAQIYKVAQEVKSGKYDGTTIAGTSESSLAYNEYFQTHGIEKITVDSGVSTQETSKIANRLLGNMPTKEVMINACGKSAAIGAIIGGLVALSESIESGSNIYDTIAHVTNGSGKLAISMGLQPVVIDGVSAILVTANAPTAVAAVTPVVVGILVPIGTEYLLTVATESIGIEDVLSNAAEKIGAAVTKGIDHAVSFVDENNISNRIVDSLDKAGDAAVSLSQNIDNTATEAKDAAIEKVSDFGNSVNKTASSLITSNS